MHALSSHEIPGRLRIHADGGELPVLEVSTPWSTAQIYLHGAHVTQYQKLGEPPLLFMSAASGFRADQAIRGGVPVIFPWFGPRDGAATHGFARVTSWDLISSLEQSDGSVVLHLRLPEQGAGYQVDYRVTVGNSLVLELEVTANGDGPIHFEDCLHTYFHVGDCREISITGLEGASYHDLLSNTHEVQSPEPIKIAAEVDRTYQPTTSTVEILDPLLNRRISVRKSDSQSTVVWNPWIAKSQRMPDFNNDEYLEMVCVESANIAPFGRSLTSTQQSRLRVELNSHPL